MKSFFKIFTILTKKQKIHCAGLAVLMIIGAALEAVGIGAIFPLISIINQPNWLGEHQGIYRLVNTVGITTHVEFAITCSITMIIIYAVKCLFIAWETKVQIDFTMHNQFIYAQQLFALYLSKPYIFHLNTNSSVLMRNIHGGAAATFSVVMIQTLVLFTEVVTGSFITVMLFMMNPVVAISIAGMFLAVIYIGVKIFQERITLQGELQNENSAAMSKWIMQGLGAIKEIKISHKEPYFYHKFDEAYHQYGNAFRYLGLANRISILGIEFITVTSLMGLIVVGLAYGVNNESLIPMLGVISLATFRLLPCVYKIMGVIKVIKFHWPIFAGLYKEFLFIKNRLELRMPIFLEESKEQLVPFEHEICIAHLSFKYPESINSILRDISFKIPQGAFVGIIGPSGAGKTTFVDLLLGLLQPTNGKILVDGVDIYDNIRGWQKNIAYVPQNIYLIDDTLKANVALGIKNEDIDNERVMQVLQMADLYEVVEKMPAGVQTLIGEGGLKLSGGQRQRIGIARALYCNPSILILDEATSALDSATERSISHTVLKLKQKITILVIAHRLSTLEKCDFKVKFDGGQVTILENESLEI